MGQALNAAAERYANVSAGCSARLSPLPFVAVRDATLLTSAFGLAALPAGHIAIVQNFEEPALSGLTEAEQAMPRMVRGVAIDRGYSGGGPRPLPLL